MPRLLRQKAISTEDKAKLNALLQINIAIAAIADKVGFSSEKITLSQLWPIFVWAKANLQFACLGVKFGFWAACRLHKPASLNRLHTVCREQFKFKRWPTVLVEVNGCSSIKFLILTKSSSATIRFLPQLFLRLLANGFCSFSSFCCQQYTYDTSR